MTDNQIHRVLTEAIKEKFKLDGIIEYSQRRLKRRIESIVAKQLEKPVHVGGYEYFFHFSRVSVRGDLDYCTISAYFYLEIEDERLSTEMAEKLGEMINNPSWGNAYEDDEPKLCLEKTWYLTIQEALDGEIAY